ncbi:hypothetical protein ACFQ60_34245 [Streptomyces zhihengii]
MSRWKVDMVNLGDQPVSKNGSTMGFQVMSNLMRWGDYDDRFLTDYGSKLIETEKKLTDNGRHEPMAWHQMGMDPMLNRTGTDSGGDPMTGFMKALANSPGAATDFFNADFVTKDEDHEFERDTDGNGKNGKVGLSNFEYLFEERDWPQDRDDKGEESITGRNNLAMALEAATTGHPAGQMPTEDTPPHSPEQARLMSDIVASVADDPKRLTDHSYMSDSIGQITSEYLPDINRAMADDPHGNTEKLFPLVGTQADLNHQDVNALLITVGQSPDGYAAVEVGQKAYMAGLLDYHLNPDLPADQRYPHSPQETVEAITRRSGRSAVRSPSACRKPCWATPPRRRRSSPTRSPSRRTPGPGRSGRASAWASASSPRLWAELSRAVWRARSPAWSWSTSSSSPRPTS